MSVSRQQKDDDDPFAVFGDEDSDSHAAAAANKQSIPARDPSNGVKVFHAGTEQALLHHIQSHLSAAEVDKLDRVISLVDKFCYQRHWMMHIGDEKGATLDAFLAERVQAHFKQKHNAQRPFVVVEVGTYCGYSSARMARVLQQHCPTKTGFHILTVDIEPRHMAVAQQLHQMAGLTKSFNPEQEEEDGGEPLISYLLLDGVVSLASHIKAWLKELYGTNAKDGSAKMNSVSFVFLDHEKDLYLSDLQQLEREGIVRAQTAVAADNVVFFRLNDYRQHIHTLAQHGVVTTKLVLGSLEYVLESDKKKQKQKQDFEDGMELTIFQKDP